MVNIHQLVLEIIQNLHKKNSLQDYKIKASILLVLILWSCLIFSQDSLVLASNIAEKQDLSFQEYFFDALTQKAINNHQKAVELLEECNSILPNDKSVLFELSKNYLNLNKTPEALNYANDALILAPNDIWLLEHLVAIHKKSKNYEEAIKLQEKIAETYPKKRQEVVYLHLRNKDNKSAKKVLTELEEAKLLNSRLRRIKENLNKVKKKSPVKTKAIEGSAKEEYAKSKSFSSLRKLLNQLETENNPELLRFSDEGMNLFPAQPFVYLMNGKALNRNKNYKKAIISLQNGIDFVIGDIQMEKRFYQEFLNAYKGLADAKNIKKYQQKL